MLYGSWFVVVDCVQKEPLSKDAICGMCTGLGFAETTEAWLPERKLQ